MRSLVVNVMYIEFIGVPGAGKTALVEEVGKLFERDGVKYSTRATFFSKNKKWKYKLAHHEGQVVLWDAGHVQRLSNLVMRHVLGSAEVTKLIYERLPKESLLILVDTPVEVSIARMKKREPARKVDGLQGSQIQTKQIQQTIFDSLGAKGVETVKLDGTKPLIENAIMLCDSVKKLL